MLSPTVAVVSVMRLGITGSRDHGVGSPESPNTAVGPATINSQRSETVHGGRHASRVSSMEQLEQLSPGMPVVWGGNRISRVTDDLAAAFELGDSLIVMQTDGTLLHVPSSEQSVARTAVDAASEAFDRMGGISDERISEFYELFASTLADDTAFAPIAAANRSDVARARSRGRSATRLILSDRMRTDMIEGLRSWRDAPGGRGSVAETIDHDGWRVDQVRDGLGVVGFVFEGRPNVFADATGVLRSGNTVVFRIGSDALGTARAIVEHALKPALSLSANRTVPQC